MLSVIRLEAAWPLGWNAFDGEDFAVADTVAGQIGCELRDDRYEFHYNDKILSSDEDLTFAVMLAKAELFVIAGHCRLAADHLEDVAYAGGSND